MESMETQTVAGYVAKRLAPEDVHPGRFVAVLSVVSEHIPMFLESEPHRTGQLEPVRIRHMPRSSEPMEVLEVCLPFVLVKQVDGAPLTLDVRRFALAGVSARFGREAFERHKAAQKENKEKKDDDD